MADSQPRFYSIFIEDFFMRVEDVNWQELIEKENFKDVQMYRGRRMSYVLFGAIANPTEKPEPTLVTLNVGAGHAQIGVIDHYVFNRGFKILKWWFPTSDAYQQFVGTVGTGRTGTYVEMTPGVWESLDNHCRQLTGKDAALEALRTSNQALEAKVKEYEAKSHSRKGE
jgi:hypothetical protein